MFFRRTDYSLFGGAESLSEGRNTKSARPPKRVVPAASRRNHEPYVFSKPPQDPKDFLWLMTEEPHRSRRTAIMKAHPEVSRFNSPIPCWLLISNNLYRWLNSWDTNHGQNTSCLSWSFSRSLLHYTSGTVHPFHHYLSSVLMP